MNRKTKDSASSGKTLKTIVIINVVGIDFVVCVLAGFYLGSYLQRITGHVLWLVAALLAGIAAGIWSVILILIRYLGGGDE